MIDVHDRREAFMRAYAKWPASWPWPVREQGRDVLYGVWVLGNDYRNRTRYYGAYPPGYLERVEALFGDVALEDTLHVFSGSLPAGRYTRCDSVQPAELRCSVYDLPGATAQRFRLVIADPPYSAADAERYGAPMVDRRRVLEALAGVTVSGGHLAWLDTTWPMHRKAQWQTVGRILIQRSTNHRVRLLSLFERTAAPAPSFMGAHPAPQKVSTV